MASKDSNTASKSDAPQNADIALSQAHRDFVSTVSHEFRTPLTSIKGFADTLLKYEGQLSAEQQRRFIQIMRDQADRLIRLVESLLEVSKNGSLNKNSLDMMFRPVVLRPLIERITQSIAIKSTGQNPFVIDIPESLPAIWADSDRLEQVLTNLIDNAVKYSGENKTVTIIAAEKPGNAQESNVCIQIIDEGIGIAPEHQEKLFTQFYRVESPLAQKVDGTGLGLYIVKSLTVAMGGSIALASEPGKGSTFTLTFPIASPERQAAYQRSRCAENSDHLASSYKEGSDESSE